MPFSRFEARLIAALAGALDDGKRKIFLDQIARFNRIHRDPHDHGMKSVEIYMYWKRWFGVYRNIPLRFDTPLDDFRFAAARVVEAENVILVEYFLVDGAMFSIKLTSQGEIFCPRSDNYYIDSMVVYI